MTTARERLDAAAMEGQVEHYYANPLADHLRDTVAALRVVLDRCERHAADCDDPNCLDLIHGFRADIDAALGTVTP